MYPFQPLWYINGIPLLVMGFLNLCFSSAYNIRLLCFALFQACVVLYFYHFTWCRLYKHATCASIFTPFIHHHHQVFQSIGWPYSIKTIPFHLCLSGQISLYGYTSACLPHKCHSWSISSSLLQYHAIHHPPRYLIMA